MANSTPSIVDIIVPCYHPSTRRFTDTQRCVSLIKKHTFIPYRLILVENLQRWMADEGDVYVGFSEPRTCAENVNTGLSLSTAPFVCVITNDVMVNGDWLEALLECFEKPDCGIATLDSSQFGRLPTPSITEDFFGGIWMINRKALNSIGLWDTQFRHAFDDADYWVRTYEAGYKIYMNHRIVVDHPAGGATIYEMNGANHDAIFQENRALFNAKHSNCTLPIFHKLR